MNRLRVVGVTVAIVRGGLACLMSVGSRALWAQSNPLSAGLKRDYRGVRDYFIRAAEKMPEANYAFQPSPDVRTFGQQVAHVADDQYNLCAPAKGETRKAAYTEIENTLSKKAELVAALKEAFTYCDGAYDALTDASGAELVSSGTMRTKFGMLNWNLWHTFRPPPSGSRPPPGLEFKGQQPEPLRLRVEM